MSRKDFPSDLPPDALETQLAKGLGLALVPIIYGVVCIRRGSTLLYLAEHSVDQDTIEFLGSEGFWLAVAYIALGVAVHFHFFWGYDDRLWRYADYGENLATVVCVGSFFYALYLYFTSFF